MHWLLILLFSPFFLLANIAQPGIYNAGGNGVFSPVFPQDSAAFQKIQMVREEVYVQVYPGFAVVKGCYWMYNTTDETIPNLANGTSGTWLSRPATRPSSKCFLSLIPTMRRCARAIMVKSETALSMSSKPAPPGNNPSAKAGSVCN